MEEQGNEELTQLLAQSPAISKQAYLLIYKAYRANVFRLAYSLLKDRELAEDMEQDTFLKFKLASKSFPDPAKVKSYLLLTCKRKCLDELKRQKRQQERVRRLAYIAPLQYNPIEEVAISRFRAAVMKAISMWIEKLPEPNRTLMKAHYYEGLRADTIALMTGIPKRTVYDRIRKLKARLLLHIKSIFYIDKK